MQHADRTALYSTLTALGLNMPTLGKLVLAGEYGNYHYKGRIRCIRVDANHGDPDHGIPIGQP